MNKEKLQIVLDKHEKWLRGETDRERADLRGADLKYADLRGADLRGVNLRDTDLTSANLTGANLRGVNLRDTDLRDANLTSANLTGVNLRGADLRGADIDFSCFPLWCGSLKAHFDDRQMVQILYHLLSAVSYSKNVSEDIKNTLLTDDLIDLANRFHRVKECGKIEI